MTQIIIRKDVDVEAVAQMQPVLREKTASKAAGRMIHIGRNAIAIALAERDPKRRRRLLTQLGFE